MNYQSIYNRITVNARSLFSINSDSIWSWRTAYNRINPSQYKELHHIVPRGMGGANIQINYCMLSPREHFLAHKLLTKIHPNNRSVNIAFFMMSGMNNKYKSSLTSREYDIIRIKSSYYNKGVNNPCAHKIGVLNHFYGKHHTQETINQARLTRSKNTYAVEWSSNHMKQLNKDNAGKNNQFYGKHHTQDTKIKLWKSNILNGKCKPFLFKGNIFLSTHSASRLLNEHRSCITRYINKNQSDTNKFLTSTDFFEHYDIDSLIWQLDPTPEQITKYSVEYKAKCDQLALNEKINQQIRHRNRSIELVTNYINGSFDNLTIYAESIGYSTTLVNNYFRMFPLYRKICIPNKPFTRDMARLLLLDGLPNDAVLPHVGKPRFY